MMVGRRIITSVRNVVRHLWIPTQQVSVLVAAADGLWTLSILRWGSCRPWSLPRIEWVKPQTGRDPQKLLRKAGCSRPDYVVPWRQIVRHLAYPTVAGRDDLGELLRLDGSRHTPFAAGRLAFAYRTQGLGMPEGRMGVSVSYCLHEDLAALADTLGACGPCQGFLPRFATCDGIGLLQNRWWGPWTQCSGLFVIATAKSPGAAAYRFLMETALAPLAVALLIVPAILLWQGRVVEQRHELTATAAHLAQPLQDLRARLHAARHLQRELAALRAYLRHAYVPETLLPRLTQALPRRATLAALRYNATSHRLSVQVRSGTPSALVGALRHMRGSTHWRVVGMAQPLRVGRYLVTIEGRWSPKGR